MEQSLRQELVVAQFSRNYPTFMELMFSTVYTVSRHRTLSWTKSSNPQFHTLFLPSGLFPSGFPALLSMFRYGLYLRKYKKK